jgi:GT2 family glycosyltransferase
MMNDGPSRNLPVVTAIVLNWNNFDDTRDCINSLHSSEYPNLKVILVDNRSSDGSFEKLVAAFPAIPCMQNSENLGFARGCNVGIHRALENPDCSYVLLVNNDCTMSASSISAAVSVMEGDTSIGVITGKIVDERNRIWHAGGTISLLRGQSRTRGFREIDVGQFEVACDTEWASGAMMLIRRNVVEAVGALPEEYFFGVEEWDYSFMVRKGGYRIRYVPTFTGVHPGGGSHDNHDPKFAYNYYRNKLIFQEKHLGRFLFALWLLPFRLYLKLRMRRHMAHLEKITYTHPMESRSDELVFAAWSALRDHGTNTLSESTMLAFDEELNSWRRQ